MSGTAYPKSVNIMKQTGGFSLYKNDNISAIARATANVFIKDNNSTM